MNYSEYLKHNEEKKLYWTAYATKILNNPKATQSEVKCAIIGVHQFSPELTKNLKEKKWYKLREMRNVSLIGAKTA